MFINLTIYCLTSSRPKLHLSRVPTVCWEFCDSKSDRRISPSEHWTGPKTINFLGTGPRNIEEEKNVSTVLNVLGHLSTFVTGTEGSYSYRHCLNIADEQKTIMIMINK